jgi:hypothetical protein
VRGLRGEVLHMFTLTGLLLPGSAVHRDDGKATKTEESGAS